jgi:nucleotide-binding universal stress UspA family protein
MRVLIAYDGSPNAEQALSLAAALRLPPGSTIHLVRVAEPTVVATPAPRHFGSDVLVVQPDARAVTTGERELAAAVERMRSSELVIEARVVAGRPATVLLEEARGVGADLVVVGSRGYTSISSLLLGSVSAEIVDHARGPVLVARRPSVTRVLLATDGSAHAAVAEAIVKRWPVFDAVPIRVVSVADAGLPWNPAIAPTMPIAIGEEYERQLDEAAGAQGQVAETAAARLRAAGRDADGVSRRGDAAAVLIEDAESFGSDLIVVGSRGLKGAMRLALGSVARNVLYGSSASVLIVRGRSGAGRR